MMQQTAGPGRQQMDKDQAISLCRKALQQNRIADAGQLIEALLGSGSLPLDLLDAYVVRSLAAGDDASPGALVARLLDLAPDQAGVHYVACHFHELTGNWQKVDYHLKRCRALGYWPDYLEVLSAVVQERTHNPREALRILDRDFPEAMQPAVWRARADAWNALKDDDSLLGPLLTYLGSQENDDRLLAHAWKAVAAAYDRRGQYGQATQALKLSNAMRYRLDGVPAQKNGLRRKIEALKHCYTPDWVASWTPGVEHDQAPVFMIGFPRSGTTLLEQVLDSHPEIVALEEKQTIPLCLRSAQLVCEAMAATSGSGVKGEGWLQVMLRWMKSQSRFSVRQIKELQALYFRQVARHVTLEAGQTLIDKMPLNTVNVGFIARLFPNARFIVSLRHPADCILSGHMQSFEMNDAMSNFLVLDDAASLYRHVMKLFWQYEAVLGLSGRVHYVRYEDLVDDLPGTVAPLLEFLGLDWDDRVCEYAEHAKQRKSLSTPSYQAVTQALYTASRYRWHNYADYLAPVLHHLQEAADRYGYSLDLPE